MAVDRKVARSLQRLAKRIQARLRSQAPVRTGRLRDSIEVRVVNTAKGVALTTAYLSYGVYTNLGTGRYYRVKYGTRQANPFFLPRNNPSPGRGRGGIRPRYWESLREEISTIERFKEEIRGIIGEELKSVIKAQATLK